MEFLRTWCVLCVIISRPSSNAKPLNKLGWSAKTFDRFISRMLSVGMVGASWLNPPWMKIDSSITKLI